MILNGMDEERLDKAVATLNNKDYPGLVQGYAFDVSDEEQVNNAVDQVEAEVGPIDILINNAGIHKRHMLMDMPLEDWKQVIDTNLTGMFIVSKAVAAKMIARGRGKIINLASLNAELARANIANYSSSKGGVVMLTKSMATEWGEFGITANAVAPGYIETDLTKPLIEDPEFNAWVTSEVPMRKWGKPEDVVGTILFLASPAADYINGFTIYVDGGWKASL